MNSVFAKCFVDLYTQYVINSVITGEGFTVPIRARLFITYTNGVGRKLHVCFRECLSIYLSAA